MNNNEIYGNQAGLNSFMAKMYGFMAGAVAISVEGENEDGDRVIDAVVIVKPPKIF